MSEDDKLPEKENLTYRDLLATIPLMSDERLRQVVAWFQLEIKLRELYKKNQDIKGH